METKIQNSTFQKNQNFNAATTLKIKYIEIKTRSLRLPSSSSYYPSSEFSWESISKGHQNPSTTNKTGKKCKDTSSTSAASPTLEGKTKEEEQLPSFRPHPPIIKDYFKPCPTTPHNKTQETMKTPIGTMATLIYLQNIKESRSEE